MSQIPSHIAASLAQGVVQQAESSKKTDAERQKAGRFSEKMRKLQEQELESVEDSYETSDEVVKIDENEQEANRDRGATKRLDGSADDEDGESRLDITV